MTGAADAHVAASPGHGSRSCPSCGSLDPGAGKFCGDCGANLPSGCPSCGSLDPGAGKFCGDCGHRLCKSPDTGAVSKPERPAPVVAACAGESGPFQAGVVVKLHGLRGAPELNGLRATCESWDTASGRWLVRLEGSADVKSVKPANLELAPAKLSESPLQRLTKTDLGSEPCREAVADSRIRGSSTVEGDGHRGERSRSRSPHKAMGKTGVQNVPDVDSSEGPTGTSTASAGEQRPSGDRNSSTVEGCREGSGRSRSRSPQRRPGDDGGQNVNDGGCDAQLADASATPPGGMPSDAPAAPPAEERGGVHAGMPSNASAATPAEQGGGSHVATPDVSAAAAEEGCAGSHVAKLADAPAARVVEGGDGSSVAMTADAGGTAPAAGCGGGHDAKLADAPAAQAAAECGSHAATPADGGAAPAEEKCDGTAPAAGCGGDHVAKLADAPAAPAAAECGSHAATPADGGAAPATEKCDGDHVAKSADISAAPAVDAAENRHVATDAFQAKLAKLKAKAEMEKNGGAAAVRKACGGGAVTAAAPARGVVGAPQAPSSKCLKEFVSAAATSEIDGGIDSNGTGKKRKAGRGLDGDLAPDTRNPVAFVPQNASDARSETVIVLDAKGNSIDMGSDDDVPDVPGRIIRPPKKPAATPVKRKHHAGADRGYGLEDDGWYGSAAWLAQQPSQPPASQSPQWHAATPSSQPAPQVVTYPAPQHVSASSQVVTPTLPTPQAAEQPNQSVVSPFDVGRLVMNKTKSPFDAGAVTQTSTAAAPPAAGAGAAASAAVPGGAAPCQDPLAGAPAAVVGTSAPVLDRPLNNKFLSEAARQEQKALQEAKDKRKAVAFAKKEMLAKVTKQMQVCLERIQDKRLDDTAREKYQNLVASLRTQMSKLTDP